MAADVVHGEAGRELFGAVVEDHPLVEDAPHHRGDVVHLERDALVRVAHAAAGRVAHLPILQVIARAAERACGCRSGRSAGG